MTPRSPEQGRRLVFGLMSAERSVRRWIDSRTDHSPVGAAGAGVLFFLANREEAPVKDIARALNASPAAATGLLNRLEAAGVIRKTPDATDTRAVRVSLTEAGRDLLPEARAVLGEINGVLSDGFTAGELETVERWLSHVSERTARTPQHAVRDLDRPGR